MTIIAGYVSEAGAVMASDSQAMEEDATTSQVDKIWSSGGLLFGYAGHLAVREAIRLGLNDRFSQSPLEQNASAEKAGSMLRAILQPILNDAYSGFVGVDDPAQRLGGSLIVIGRGQERHWIAEIDRNNTFSNYTTDGFHTVGTGSVAAHVSRGLLSHYHLPGQEVRHLQLLAFRTVEICIRILGGAYGIGGQIQLWQSPDSGGYSKVEGEELSSVSEGLQQWTLIERESLERVFASGDGVSEIEQPLPGPLESE